MQLEQILFIDFNGVISYDNYWKPIETIKHPLHKYHNSIEKFLFKESPEIVNDWMLGKYTSEQVHLLIHENTGAPADELFNIFEKGCREIDISTKILRKINQIKNQYYCILATGNMDCFDRFTLDSNQILTSSFDEIDNSYNIGLLKTSNSGEYFLSRAQQKNIDIRNCVVIDDSPKVCEIFTKLGGKSFCVSGEKEVIDILNKLDINA